MHAMGDVFKLILQLINDVEPKISDDLIYSFLENSYSRSLRFKFSSYFLVKILLDNLKRIKWKIKPQMN